MSHLDNLRSRSYRRDRLRLFDVVEMSKSPEMTNSPGPFGPPLRKFMGKPTPKSHHVSISSISSFLNSKPSTSIFTFECPPIDQEHVWRLRHHIYKHNTHHRSPMPLRSPLQQLGYIVFFSDDRTDSVDVASSILMHASFKLKVSHP